MKNKNKNSGYDARNNQPVEDMIKAGIIDPLKVTRTALENAVSMAAILLTSEAAIADKPEKSGAGQMPPMPGMGGMM
jgi:chaperonin GroEL